MADTFKSTKFNQKISDVEKITSLLSAWAVLLAAQVICPTVRGLRDRGGGHWLDEGFKLMVNKQRRKALSSVWKYFAAARIGRV
jgi:hypothetical protein